MRFAYLIAVLAFALAACTTTPPSYSQAAAPAFRPAPRPPMFTPGYSPNTQPEPAHTPAGAGLPGERVPGTAAPGVTRSPNKRLLPASEEPGLWAADGDPALMAGASTPPEILGVHLPLSAEGTSESAGRCARGAENGLASIHDRALRSELERLPLDARRCAVADFYERCVESILRTQPRLKGLKGWEKANAEVLQQEEIKRRYGPDLTRARAFRAEACRSFPHGPLLHNLVQRLLRVRDLSNLQSGD